MAVWGGRLPWAGQPSAGTHDLIQAPGQAFGVPMLEMRSLIWTQEKFKEVCSVAHASVFGAGKQTQG